MEHATPVFVANFCRVDGIVYICFAEIGPAPFAVISCQIVMSWWERDHGVFEAGMGVGLHESPVSCNLSGLYTLCAVVPLSHRLFLVRYDSIGVDEGKTRLIISRDENESANRSGEGGEKPA